LTIFEHVPHVDQRYSKDLSFIHNKQWKILENVSTQKHPIKAEIQKFYWIFSHIKYFSTFYKTLPLEQNLRIILLFMSYNPYDWDRLSTTFGRPFKMNQRFSRNFSLFQNKVNILIVITFQITTPTKLSNCIFVILM